jgi:hypothetical protein
MQNTNWPAFGIGMAAGVALSLSLYFGWALLRPAPREADNVAVTANLPMPLDENALVAANAERPANAMIPPPQLRPEAEPEPEPEPAPVVVVREPPVVRPTPRPEPYDPPPEDDEPPPEDLDKPLE